MLNKLLICAATVIALPLVVHAQINDPNKTEQPVPGWGPWRPSSEISQADYSAGFSNSELGGFLDFKQACADALRVPVDTVPYWFRLSDLVAQIGTGQVEYGCSVGGNITTTLVITAIKSSLKNVTCLQVNAMDGGGVPVYPDPDPSSRQIRTLRNTSRVNPGSFPALVGQRNGQNWISIQWPVKGWVVQGAPGSSGNLHLCKPFKQPITPTKTPEIQKKDGS